MKPIIGITVDYSTREHYSRYPWYALRTNYAEAITEHAGTPILLPYSLDGIHKYLDLIDGLLITGGDFDIHPKFYNEEITSATVMNTIDRRTQFELAMLEGAMQRDIPVLGICGGMQLINVYCGGTLIQHIPELGEVVRDHQQPYPKHIPFHPIKVQAKTKLGSLVCTEEYSVNSTHHQAIRKLGEGLVVSAIAPDGIIEAIEHSSHSFCLAVQWHPEYCHIDQDKALMNAFVQACHQYTQDS